MFIIEINISLAFYLLNSIHNMKLKLLLIKGYLLALFLTISITNVQAQVWTEKATAFQNGISPPKTNLIAIATDNIIWSVGTSSNSASQFSKTSDGGTTWVNYSFTGLPSGLTIYDITATSALKAWICTYSATSSANGGIYATIDGGATWTKQTTALFNSTNSLAQKIRFFNDNVGIALGRVADGYFEIYRTSNGGTNWSRVAQANIPVSTSAEVINGFDATLDGSSIWFSSFQNGALLYRSTNGGATWSTTTLTYNDTTYAGLFDFYFSFRDASTGFAIGKVGGVRRVMKTIDGGATFNIITTTGTLTSAGSYYGNTELKCIPGTDTVIVNRYYNAGAGTPGSYISTNGGSTWAVFGTTTKNIYRMAFNANVGFGGTDQDYAGTGGIFKYSSTGWIEKATHYTNNGTTYTSTGYVSIANDNVIWALGTNSDSNYAKQYSKSIDGGNTWTAAPLNVGASTTSVLGITATSASKAWVITYDSAVQANTGVFNTIDGGTTWTKQTTALFNDASSFPDNIRFFDDNNGIVQGDPTAGASFEIYRTSDGGTNWIRVPLANFPALISGEYGFTGNFDSTPNGSVIWFGATNGSTNNRLYKSTDFGNTWSVNALAFTDYRYCFSFKDGLNGLLLGTVGTTTTLQRTTDGGTTFTTITPTGFTTNASNYYTGAIKSIPGTNTFIYKNGTNNYYSGDFGGAFGTNWTAFGSSTKSIGNMVFKNAHTGFGTTFNESSTQGGIYKYTSIVSLIGDALPGTAWANDVNMATTDGINYSLTNIYINAGSVKFRQSNSWGDNWGGTFPSAFGYANGPDIAVSPAGNYNVAINTVTGFYTFSPNLSTDEYSFSSITISPNPTHSILTIQNNSNSVIDKIRVIDLTGKKVLETEKNTTIDVSALENGIYILEVFSGENKITKKFIKE